MSFNGIILLNKPAGLSSNGALSRAKYLLNIKKAGHTGSLDPIATGMLPLCFQEATKFSRFLLEAEKTYIVTAVLGIRTDTGDTEGTVIAQKPVPAFTESKLQATLGQFLGPQMQVPPMYSALKKDGQPLYKLARQGIAIERPPRAIEIYDIALLNVKADAEEKTLQVRFSVSCSKGTYIRSLVEDIGAALDVGGHVSGLHRTSVGPFKSNLMYSLEDIANLHEKQQIAEAVIPIEAALSQWPTVQVSSSSGFYLRQGQPVRVPDKAEDWVKIMSHEGHFMGVGEMLGDGRLAPRRLLQA